MWYDSICCGDETPKVEAIAFFEGREGENVELDDVVKRNAHKNDNWVRDLNRTRDCIAGVGVFPVAHLVSVGQIWYRIKG